MSNLDDQRAVVELAILTEDRTLAEQRALLRVARAADHDWNKQSTTNPRIRHGSGSIRVLPGRGGELGPQCTYSADHPKDKTKYRPSCPCHGSGVAIEPEGGWSYLEREAVFSWQPDDDKLTRLAKELRDGWESGYIVETNPL